MSEKNKSVSVLVPVELPLDIAWIQDSLQKFINKKMEIVLLHVVDSRILYSLQKGSIEAADGIYKDLKSNAEAQLHKANEGAEHTFSTIVVEGIPFLEIIKISKDLKVDLIAMKMRSSQRKIENLFFGSTTERVLRGSPVPVICLP